ncbi:MAG: hypothetical protein ABDH20_00690 [Thermus sp.]
MEVPVPEAERERVRRFRQEVLKAIVETDEGLLEKYWRGRRLRGRPWKRPSTRRCARASSTRWPWPRGRRGLASCPFWT